MKTRLIQFIQQQFGSDFSDFVESSLAIMLIENWAFLADTLSFKMDQIANEIFIDTVTEIENAFRLAQLVGFKPQPPIASSSLWTATLNNPILTDLVVPTPYEITVQSGNQTTIIELFPADANNNAILDQDILIPAGNVVNASVIGLQGQTQTLQVTGSGQVGQTITLANNPVIFDSVVVDVDGVRWTQVDSFTDSQPRREFLVSFDSTYTAFVIFGNGTAGLLPSSGSQIVVTYRQGGGTIGNIVSGAVTSQTVVPVPGLDFPVAVTFRNYTQGQFGYAGDTIDDIRAKLPAWIATQNRAVTGLDYKTLSEQFATPYQGQIGKATAVLRNYGCSGNIVDIYVLALGADVDTLQLASDDLKVSLQEYLFGVQMFTDFVCIRDGIIIPVAVTIDVTLNRLYRKFQDQFNVQITNLVNSFFALANWDYNKNLKASDIVKALSTVTELIQIDITFVTNDPKNGGQTVVANFNEIIRPENIEIVFNYQ
jgi:hypothetical protein